MKCRIIIAILIIVILSGCKANESVNESESVIVFEENNYKLSCFDITYDSYKENIKGILDENSVNRDEEIIFGYNDKNYYGKDLIGLDLKKMKELKENFYGRFAIFDLDTLRVKMKISKVYKEDKIKVVYAAFKKTADTRSDSITMYSITKYSFKEIEGKWLIYGVEKLNYDNEEMIEIYESEKTEIDNIQVEFINEEAF